MSSQYQALVHWVHWYLKDLTHKPAGHFAKAPLPKYVEISQDALLAAAVVQGRISGENQGSLGFKGQLG